MKKLFWIAVLALNATVALGQSGDDITVETKPAKADAAKDPKAKAEEFEKIVKALKRVDGPFPMEFDAQGNLYPVNAAHAAVGAT